MNHIKLCMVAALVLVFCAPLAAQKSGKITGTVTDGDSGEPLPGANVIVPGTTMGAATDIDGNYVILRVPPGTYELRSDFIGYGPVLTQNVQVLTDLTTTIDFKMRSEAVELGQEVVVLAERPIVRKDLTSSEARVQADEIRRLPVQELGDVLNLQAGISRDSGGGIHIRGGRRTDVAYMVNGIRITDDFTRSQSIQVENESIQELQVISGTFNAEYGEALSGVINIVTKTGSNEFHGNFEAWSGDYLTSRDDVFFKVDDVSPTATYNFAGSLGGPIIRDKVTFFATARRLNNDGWIYGPNAFRPDGRFLVNIANGDTTFIPNPGDSSAVPLNFTKRWSGQSTLEWRISAPLKFKVDALGSMEERGTYSHDWRLNPLGDRGDDEKGGTVIANVTHALSGRTFYELTGSYKYNELKSVLFDDPFDPRYIHPDSTNHPGNQFIRAGTDLERFARNTKSWIGKFDLTSQISKRHQIKTGLELKWDQVFMEDITLIPATDAQGQQIQPFQPQIRPSTEPSHDLIERKPFTFAAYLQDKIEYESLVINVGLRFDMFNPKGRVPVDLSDPNINSPFKLRNLFRDTNSDGVIGLEEQTVDNQLTLAEREAYWYRNTSTKTQLSPRLGVAYPITERGVIHFSYGIFRQTPDYEQLYRGDELKVTQAAGLQGGKGGSGFGNPDLKPQRTTMYEIGLQQQLSDNIGADLTLYYRDIRDWISTGPAIDAAIAGVSYARRINRDFANVFGITMAFSKRFADHYSFDIDYTFQIAEGTNSNPDAEFFAQRDNDEPTKQLTPLDWDQAHSANATFFVGSNDWGISLIERFNSGQPYTPEIIQFGRTGEDITFGLQENSRRKPTLFTLDLTAFKDFNFSGYRVKLFAKMFNVLDAKNPDSVFGDSGLADFTFNSRAVEADDSYYIRPDFFAEPRRIQVGASFGF
jgi:outer membrane receptor protein involved in Fe transport